MSQYDKIWIEVDVEQDRENKTEKIKEVIESLEKAKCVKNITKVQYEYPMQEGEV